MLFRDGRYERLGITDTLTRAHEIRQVAASNPMDRVAVLRFLLALLYWCKGNPPRDAQTQLHEPLPSTWFTALTAHRGVFELFGSGKRFYQYGGLGKKKPLSVNSLIHEVPTGTNINHFRHSIDGEDGLCPACCALGLIRLPLFTTQGGQGKRPGVNFKPPIYLIPAGDNLAETLRLSWMQIKNLGAPIWNRDTYHIPIDGEILFLEALTALPRRVWLRNPDIEDRCISCGRFTDLVRECDFEGAPKRELPNSWQDPHVVYFLNEDEIRSARADNTMKPGGFRTDRPWSRLMERFLGAESLASRDTDTRFLIVGFASDQTKYIDAWERTFTLPANTNRIAASDAIDRWSAAGARMPWRIKHPSPQRKPSSNEKAIIGSIRPHIEHTISSNLTELVTWDDESWNEASMEYRKLMEGVAESLSPGYSTAAVRRRGYLSRVLPDLSQKQNDVSETEPEDEEDADS